MIPRPPGYEARPRITPELMARFAAYHRTTGGAWGSLHVLLDDANYGSGTAQFCAEWAESTGDTEGRALAQILSAMTKTQQKRIRARIR